MKEKCGESIINRGRGCGGSDCCRGARPSLAREDGASRLQSGACQIRYIPCKRVTFKCGLGAKFINVIKVIKMLGMHHKKLINVKGVKVSPIEVVAACLPNPASLGGKMSGKTCVGTWVTGIKAGERREVYLYQAKDNQESMKDYGCQIVSLQTATRPVIVMELIALGIWKGNGVLRPEAFDPRSFLKRMPEYNFHYKIIEAGAQ